MQALAEGTDMMRRLKSLASANRLKWPVSLDEIRRYKIPMKEEDQAAWAALTSQGKGVKALTNYRIGNAWLYNPTLLKPDRFITALKMRTNTTANKTVVYRTNRSRDMYCQKCKSKPETQSHTLGQCVLRKEHTIRRHNELLNFVIDKIARSNKEAALTKETTYTLPEGRSLKPDLDIQDQEGIRVIDVTIRHEDNDYLAQGHQDKVEKYTVMLPHLQRDLGRNTAEVLPIVVGTRGATPKATVRNLTKLGLTDTKSLITMSLITLRKSIVQFHIFMDYDTPRFVPEDPG